MLQRAGQPSAKARKTRRLVRMIHRATSASTVLVNLSGAEERKYCTAHHASIVPLSRDAIAGDLVFRRSWRRCIASCGGFRYRCVRPCSRLPFTRTSAQNGWEEKVLDFGGPGGARRIGCARWDALVGCALRSVLVGCTRWEALDGRRSWSLGSRSAAIGLYCCQRTS